MEFKNRPIESLIPNPHRPRQTFRKETLLSLAASIRKYGLLSPILIAQTPAGNQVIAGERRLRAAKMAGLTEIPCLILKDLPASDLAFLSLTENLQQEELNLLDQAGVLGNLLNNYQYSLFDIADRLGMEEDEVERIIKLLNLPDKIKTAYLRGDLSNINLLELVGISDPIERLEEFNRLSAK